MPGFGIAVRTSGFWLKYRPVTHGNGGYVYHPASTVTAQSRTQAQGYTERDTQAMIWVAAEALTS